MIRECKPPLRILDTGLRPARWNVAMTAALAEPHAAGTVCDTVRFHRYPTCVLLGAGQDMDSAADVAWCRRAGIEMARRVTGGGAVYMSPDMLAWDVLVDRRAHGGDQGGDQGGDLEAITRRVCGGVAVGLSRLGAEARFRAPNDIAILGRKVSGSSGYAVGRSAVLQGTVLTADDVVEMAHALRLPEAALRERVTCLGVEIGYAPAPADLMQCIVAGLAGTLGGEAQLGEPSGAELALCESLLRDEIGADDYVAGRSAAPA